MTTKRSFSARLAIGLAAVAMGLSMVVAQTGGAGYTEAAWQDKEVGQVSVQAAWADSAWAKSTVSNLTTFGNFPGMSYGSPFSHTPSQKTSSTTPVADRYRDTGLTNNINVRTPAGRTASDMYACASVAAPPAGTVSTDNSTCNQTGAPGYPFGSSLARARGFGRTGMFTHPNRDGGNPLFWIFNESVSTVAECRADGSSFAAAPQASNGTFQGVGFITTASLISGNSDSEYTYVSPVAGTTVSKWILPNKVGTGSARAWHYVSVTSRNFTADGYALSDIFAQVHFYDTSTAAWQGSIEMVLSRSECGVGTPARIRTELTNTFSHIRRPATRPANPAAVAEVVTAAAVPHPTTGIVPGQFQTFAEVGRMAMRAAPETTTLTSLPPATTVTSPLESATATVTTTSAPPDPSPTDPAESTANPTTTATVRESTTTTAATTAASATSTTPVTRTVTTTSATPAPSIPSEPGDLSATAETELAGTVEVDGEDNDVVVEGDTVPVDAPTAAQALDTWINDARQPSGDWTTFTSTDPDEDGWRWAAINQKTGTVVYIR